MTMENNKWINVSEVARIFEVSPPTVYNWIRKEKLPKPIILGGTRWDRQSFKDWLHSEYGDMIHA